MQRSRANVPIPPAAMEQVSRLLSEPRAAKVNLGKALAERDETAAFDRCMVDGEACERTAIRAHCIPQTALELIANSSKEVIAAHSSPPKTMMQWVHEYPLKRMTIGSFNAAKWACRPHDDMFGPLDTKQLTEPTDRKLFLLIYKITVYLTHRVLHTGERLAVPILDHAVETPLGLTRETSADLASISRSMSYSAVRVWWIKQQVDKMLKNDCYNQIDYRIYAWRTTPAMAGVGMIFADGPGNQNTWFGENSLIPVWIALLPQEHGQTIITASPRGTASYTRNIHRGVSGDRGAVMDANQDRTDLMCRKVLAYCSDIALSEEMFDHLSEHEQNRLQHFLHQRSLLNIRRYALPNVFEASKTSRGSSKRRASRQ